MAGTKRKNKYGNKKVQEDGYTFDSEAEFVRYRQLKYFIRTNRIENLIVHPSFKLSKNGHVIATYYSDFQYDTIDPHFGPDRTIVEDVKGVRTREYAIKIKFAHAQWGREGYEFFEIPAADVKNWADRIPERIDPNQPLNIKADRTDKVYDKAKKDAA